MNQTQSFFSLGLMGDPLGHSLSPILHTAALKAAGLAGDYRLFPVPQVEEGRQALVAMIEKVRSGEVHGLNVTIPHKTNVFPYMQDITHTALRIGAINTIYMKDGLLSGHNTDAEGFRIDFMRHFNAEPARALVIGSGGSARAVINALNDEGWMIGIAARNISQAAALPAAWVFPYPLNAEKTLAFGATLIVNTTPLGMSPDFGSTPWPEEIPFPRNGYAYDLVYNPEKTRFLEQAEAAGCRIANGLGMLIEQAALAFEIWTGHPADREAMSAALKT